MYSCVALGSFDQSGRGFVIPLFSFQGSNQTFAQDLDHSGKIIRFIPANEMPLHPIQMHPAPLIVDVGDQGIIGFIDDDENLELGTIDLLAENLRGVSVEDPFTRIELAALLKDRNLQAEALADSAELIDSAQSTIGWVKREVVTFEDVLSFSGFGREEENGEIKSQLWELLSRLEHDQTIEDWGGVWLRLWGQNFERRKLIGLAYLRQDQSKDFGRQEVTIFSSIYDVEHTDEAFERLFRALDRTVLGTPQWIQSFQKILRMRYWEREEILELGIRKVLGTENAARDWVPLWNAVYPSQDHDDELLRVAVDYVMNTERLSPFVARTLLWNLADEPEYFQIVKGRTREWLLENVRSDNVWAYLFERTYGDVEDPELSSVGLRWLQSLGGNLSAWPKIWRMYRTELTEDESTSLALAWLGRARKDMLSWVKVFMELFENNRETDYPELMRLAEDWLRARVGNVINRRRIGDALKYMENRSGL